MSDLQRNWEPFIGMVTGVFSPLVGGTDVLSTLSARDGHLLLQLLTFPIFFFIYWYAFKHLFFLAQFFYELLGLGLLCSVIDFVLLWHEIQLI